MSYQFNCQERIVVDTFPHKGVVGYVRMVTASGYLWVLLDNGLKISIKPDDVSVISSNYFDHRKTPTES